MNPDPISPSGSPGQQPGSVSKKNDLVKSNIGSPALVLSFLRDDNPSVRTASAARLGLMGESASFAVPDLMLAVASEKDAAARQAMTKALFEVGPAGHSALIFLVRAADGDLQLDAVKVLARGGTTAGLALPALEYLIRQESGDLAKEAGRALTSLYKKPIPANFLEGDLNRFAIEWAKRLYLPPRAPGSLPGPGFSDTEREAREDLSRALVALYSKDAPRQVVTEIRSAEAALSAISLKDREKILVNALLNFGLGHPDDQVKLATLNLHRALKLGAENSGALLFLALNSEDPVRAQAINTLRELKTSSNGTSPQQLLLNEAGSVDNLTASRALVCLGKYCLYPSQEVIEVFRKALTSADENVVIAAATGLYELKPWASAGVSELFARMLQSPIPEVCRLALTAFTEFMFLAGDDEKSRSLTLLENIIRKGPSAEPGQIPAKQKALIQAGATLCVGSIVTASSAAQQKRALGILAQAAQNPSNPDMRRAAYTGLYNIARQTDDDRLSKTAVMTLGWALEDETDEEARQMVSEYLGNIEPEVRPG